MKMGLMPIIFTALCMFVVSAVVILLISYITYKLRPKQKPYLEVKNTKPAFEPNKPFYTVPAYEPPVRKPLQRTAVKQHVRYRDVNRFEILNQQKPRYMQTSESRTFTTESEAPQNIYQYYSNSYNDREFRTVTL